MCCWTLTLAAALLAQGADPPPADPCCLTYGQVQAWIQLEGYIPTTAVSQCLVGSATLKSAYPSAGNEGFLFIPDQTVGLRQNKDNTSELCLQWKAVEKAVKTQQILLMYDGKPSRGENPDELQAFHKKVKPNDVVILVMRYVPQKKACELAQLHVVPIEKVAHQKQKGKN